MIPRWNRYPGRSTILFLVLGVLLFVVEHINGRFWLNDFRVYYGAANALLAGEPLYGVAHGLDSGVFKYAPIMALLYVPLALLPYPLAAAIQYFLIVAAFIGALHLADRLVRQRIFRDKPGSYAPLLLTGLVVIVHLHRELHLGNINVMLLFILLLVLHLLLEGRTMLSGILLGLAVLAKPHFVVLLPLFLLHRQWRALAATSGMVLFGMLVPALFLGFGANATLLGEWAAQMASHNAALIYTGGEGYEAVNTVYSFLHRTFSDNAPASWEVPVILAGIALAVGALVLHALSRGVPFERSFTFTYLLLLGLVPCITLTDTEHFLLALPMIALTLHHLLPKAQPRWILPIALPALVAFGGNWQDALGPWSDMLVHYGVLGVGTLVLLVLHVVLFLRSTGSNQADRGTS